MAEGSNDIARYFDAFVAAFTSFDGKAVGALRHARRRAHARRCTARLSTQQDVEAYYQAALDTPRAELHRMPLCGSRRATPERQLGDCNCVVGSAARRWLRHKPLATTYFWPARWRLARLRISLRVGIGVCGGGTGARFSGGSRRRRGSRGRVADRRARQACAGVAGDAAASVAVGYCRSVRVRIAGDDAPSFPPQDRHVPGRLSRPLCPRVRHRTLRGVALSGRAPLSFARGNQWLAAFKSAQMTPL